MKILVFLAAFLVAISILVAVHEFGHYWVAKKLGFKVLRFSIGFGKPLFTRVGKDADRTEYCLAAIPLGGYVKLLDEREGDVAAAELHRSFTRRPISQRIAVLLAGPAMNLLFASLLYAILAMVGTEVVKPVVGQVRLDSPAAVAGLQRGDQIVRVGSHNVEDTEELQIALIRQFSSDGLIALRVRRDGSERSLNLRVIEERLALTEPGKLLPGLGFDLASWNAAVTINSAPVDSAGARAGLSAGDRLLAVDGQPVRNASEFISMVSGAANRDISVEVERHGERLRIVAAVPRVMDQGKAIGRLGISLKEGPPVWPPGLVEIHRSGPIDAVAGGVAKTWEMSALTVQMLWRMLSGQVSPKNISGVVSIAEFAGISAYLGVTAYLAFLAIISVSLGVLNLMPVPLLDGGQVVYQVVEAIKGSPISERTQLFGQQVGIALLVVLMSLAFYNDISRHLN
jgi:regulator of sigma E protease